MLGKSYIRTYTIYLFEFFTSNFKILNTISRNLEIKKFWEEGKQIHILEEKFPNSVYEWLYFWGFF